MYKIKPEELYILSCEKDQGLWIEAEAEAFFTTKNVDFRGF